MLAEKDKSRCVTLAATSKEKLTALDGDLTFQKNEFAATAMRETHIINDRRVEKYLAIHDVVCRLFRNAPVENLSCITRRKTAHDYEMAPIVAGYRRHT